MPTRWGNFCVLIAVTVTQLWHDGSISRNANGVQKSSKRSLWKRLCFHSAPLLWLKVVLQVFFPQCTEASGFNWGGLKRWKPQWNQQLNEPISPLTSPNSIREGRDRLARLKDTHGCCPHPDAPPARRRQPNLICKNSMSKSVFSLNGDWHPNLIHQLLQVLKRSKKFFFLFENKPWSYGKTLHINAFLCLIIWYTFSLFLHVSLYLYTWGFFFFY